MLRWDKKASHPWILYLELPYDGQSRNGMPDEHMQELLTTIEEAAMEELKDRDGYLNIGRQTGENTRKLYFACKDFRKPSLVAHLIQQQFGDQIAVEFDIYKDKYWQSFQRFRSVASSALPKSLSLARPGNNPSVQVHRRLRFAETEVVRGSRHRWLRWHRR